MAPAGSGGLDAALDDEDDEVPATGILNSGSAVAARDVVRCLRDGRDEEDAAGVAEHVLDLDVFLKFLNHLCCHHRFSTGFRLS